MAFDPCILQHAINPESVEASLLNDDEREDLPRPRPRFLPKLRKALKKLCDTSLSHPKTLNLSDRLLSPKRDAKKLFTFLKRPGMPPTNNHAERALRGPVLSRKISFGSRSAAGANAFAAHK